MRNGVYNPLTFKGHKEKTDLTKEGETEWSAGKIPGKPSIPEDKSRTSFMKERVSCAKYTVRPRKQRTENQTWVWQQGGHWPPCRSSLPGVQEWRRQ